MVLNLPAMQVTLVQFLGWEDLLEKRQATHFSILGLPWWLSWLRICLQCGRPGFDPWVGKIPWRREQLPTPVFWPGKFHGLYSPWGRKELDRTEQLSLSLRHHGLRSLAGYGQWGCKELDMTEVTKPPPRQQGQVVKSMRSVLIFFGFCNKSSQTVA